MNSDRPLRAMWELNRDPKTGQCASVSMGLSFAAKAAFIFDRGVLVGAPRGALQRAHPSVEAIRNSFFDCGARCPDLPASGRGAEHIQRETTRMIDAVQWVYDGTVEGMNAGKGLRELMAEVVPPPELTLTEEYGKVAWNVRAIWHEYTGWHDPARGVTDLYGVPASSVAPAIAELAGGADKLAERARAFVAEGKPLEALHLLDVALAAEPSLKVGREVKRQALELLSQQTGGKNLWERMSIAAEIRELDGGPSSD